mgnify:CR=1 FL=1
MKIRIANLAQLLALHVNVQKVLNSVYELEQDARRFADEDSTSTPSQLLFSAMTSINDGENGMAMDELSDALKCEVVEELDRLVRHSPNCIEYDPSFGWTELEDAPSADKNDGDVQLRPTTKTVAATKENGYADVCKRCGRAHEFAYSDHVAARHNRPRLAFDSEL